MAESVKEKTAEEQIVTAANGTTEAKPIQQNQERQAFSTSPQTMRPRVD